jgi:hypothetical protein
MVLNSRRKKDRRRTARLDVWLDGIHRPNCFHADGRRGVIREFLTNEENAMYTIDRDGETIIAVQELRGKVTWVRI